MITNLCVIADILSALKIEGSVQIHTPDLLVIPDVRATQIFMNVAEYKDRLPGFLSHRYTPDTFVWLLSLKGSELMRHGIKLGELPLQVYAGQEHLLIEAQKKEHPGGLYGLVYLTDRLLGPGGCPWDQAQTHETLKKNLIEETYEVLDAIDSKSNERLLEELGDLLLQPVLHAQIEKHKGGWDIDVVADKIAEKIVRRHPHVFGSKKVATTEEALASWEEIKQKERTENGRSLLDDIPSGLPALFRAYKVSQRCAREGFEWERVEEVFEKLQEEIQELKEAYCTQDSEDIESELGDLLFTVVNIARWLHVEPEEALRKMLNRFIKRFQYIEQNTPKPLRELSPEEWGALWQKAKQESFEF